MYANNLCQIWKAHTASIKFLDWAVSWIMYGTPYTDDLSDTPAK